LPKIADLGLTNGVFVLTDGVCQSTNKVFYLSDVVLWVFSVGLVVSGVDFSILDAAFWQSHMAMSQP